MTRRRLTRRQWERIKQAQEQRRLRAVPHAVHRTVTPNQSDLGPEQPGLVIANHGPALIVEDQYGALYRCAVRQNLGTLVCGDRIIWQASCVEEGVVIAREERRALLTRPNYSGRLKPLAANLDQVALVMASYPELNEFLIDRYLVAIAAIRVTPLLVLNKVDILDREALAALKVRLSTYTRIGYSLLLASTRLDHGLDALRNRFKDRTSILVGQSGVGKSSLVQALLPDQEIRIQGLSQATGRGTHTTTTATLYHLPSGGDLIDSPGVRSFALGTLELRDVEQGFVELTDLLKQCRFSDCTHTVETGCALLAAVARKEIDPRRLMSYQQIKNSLRTA
jgi:ribosome biogenesis GTPase